MEEGRIEGGTASDHDFPIVIASMPATRQERVHAAGFIALLVALFAIIVPFASVPLARVDSFVPTLQSVMCAVDLITAALLFSQYSVLPMPAILALASGYVFSALFAFMQTLAFPGAYSANGLFGDGVNTAAWLFVLWHTSFSISIIVYALLKNMGEPAGLSRASAGRIIAAALACIGALTAALTWVAAVGATYLPNIYQNTVQQTSFAANLNLFLWLLSLVALVLLFIRRRTVLDTWLLVVLIAWWPNFLVAIFFTSVRFSLGWYAARCFALVATSTLLFVLLAETMVLYARLANAIRLLRRERSNRLMSLEAAVGAVAHEISQPLTGIASSGAAALNYIKRQPLRLDEVVRCLTSVVDGSHRTREILASVRRLFRATSSERTMQHIDDIILETINLMQHDIQLSGISVTTGLHGDLPQINADRMQIQQLILNLVKNAIEAMRSSPEGKRQLRVATGLNGDSGVSVVIEDTGPGIGAKERDSIFDPFFTTKKTSTGLGLAICRTIVEGHGGRLMLVESSFRGSVFEIAFPTSNAQQASR
jgi:signal transduction histidine kinase